MKNICQIFLLSFLISTQFAVGQMKTPLSTKGSIESSQQIVFTENKGQIHDQFYQPRQDVLYSVMVGGMSVHIKKSGVSYQLYRADSWKEQNAHLSQVKQTVVDQQTIYRVDLNWLNANLNFITAEDEVTPGYATYYSESCPQGAMKVRSYRGITIRNLYDGIDLHYYEKNGNLKHDYIVAPHADYKKISIELKGASAIVKEDGSLILETPLGKIQEGAPVVYQNLKQLKANWSVVKTASGTVLSFEVNNYDPNYQLIIDPVTRLWGSYYGGQGEDSGVSCATDGSGNVYLAGTTNSSGGTSIATTGSHQTVLFGSDDGFLVKFNSAGIRQWSTYYGGTGGDYGQYCATDGFGNVYLAGTTTSSNGAVMTSAGSHQTIYGGSGDGFLVKFNANGLRLWATFYGGTGLESAYACATDNLGNVFITGNSTGGAGTAIATLGSHQPTYTPGGYNGGWSDGFLVKFNSNGVRQWGTFYGGAGNDEGHGVAIDASGNVYIVGSTGGTSGTAIATPGSHQPFASANYDGFLAKFDNNGVRLWGTYYGGLGDDGGWTCATDASGNVYMSGMSKTSGGTAIATSGSHQSAHGGGMWDAMIVKFNASGVRQWGSYYGGTGAEFGYGCATDASGNVFLAGYTSTNTSSLISTSGSHQSYFAGINDLFLAKFNASGTRQWGTYYGGFGDEQGYSPCAVDANGAVYLAGQTKTSNGTAIKTVNSHQATYGGGLIDGFIAKFDVCTVPPNQPSSVGGSSTVCSDTAGYVYTAASVSGAFSYNWSLPAGWIGSSISNTISAAPGSSGLFSVTAVNACGSSSPLTFSVTVYPMPSVTVNSGTICSGQAFTIIPQGAITYSFSNGPIVVPVNSSTFSVIGISAEGCNSFPAISTVVVNALPNVAITSNDSIICVGESVTLNAMGALNYTFSPGGSGTNIIISPTAPTDYTLTGVDVNGCVNVAVFKQGVDACNSLRDLPNGKLNEITLQVYPNPATSILWVELNVDSQIEMVNTLGEIVFAGMLTSGQNSISIEHLKAGLYIARKVDTANPEFVKVIIAR